MERRESIYASHLSEWATRNKVTTALFDLDDTLLETHKCFVAGVQAFEDAVLPYFPHMSAEELHLTIQELNNSTYQKYGVAMNKWDVVVDQLISMGNPVNSDDVKSLQGHLYSIYCKVPELVEGAVTTLESIKLAGLKVGIVTHADEDWTLFKLRAHNLLQYADFIHSVDPRGHKTELAWKAAIDAIKAAADQVVVIGDNFKGDILASRAAGVQHQVWISTQDSWSIYQQSTPVEGIITISRVDELIPALLRAS